MSQQSKRDHRRPGCANAAVFTPFRDSEEAWFWFMSCYEYHRSGARLKAGLGCVVRPCEPGDILRIADDLLRCGQLRAAHARVLAVYGRDGAPPGGAEPRRPDHAVLWREAHRVLARDFAARGIIKDSPCA